jgi:hypothetical protein
MTIAAFTAAAAHRLSAIQTAHYATVMNRARNTHG